MSTDRILRVNELLKREIAEGLFRVMNEAAFDPGAVTVTRVLTSSDLRRARVMVSVRGEEPARRQALRLLYRHRRDIEGLVRKDVVLRYIPRLSFEMDDSIREGDRVLQILSEIETADEPDALPSPTPDESEPT